VVIETRKTKFNAETSIKIFSTLGLLC